MRREGQARVQYVFLDVVKFTVGRTVEAQVDVVKALNAIVLESLDRPVTGEDDRILVPTGDGILVVLLESEQSDLALQVAMTILMKLEKYNKATVDKRRRFTLRVAVNENVDNLVIDVNERLNIAGRGVNQAQRILGNADGCQILVGQTVHELLCDREPYEGAFRRFEGGDKHGNSFPIFQLVLPDQAWLNRETPKRFVPKTQAKNLSLYVAHYLLNASVNRTFLFKRRNETLFPYVAPVFIHMLTLDSLDEAKRNPLEPNTCRVTRSSDGSLKPTWDEIDRSNFWVVAELAKEIEEDLSNWFDCFESTPTGPLLAFPSSHGVERARKEYPDVAAVLLGKDGEQST